MCKDNLTELHQPPKLKPQEENWLPHSGNVAPWGETSGEPDQPRQKYVAT